MGINLSLTIPIKAGNFCLNQLTVESELPIFITLEFKVKISPWPIKLFTMSLFWIQAVPLTYKLDKKLVKLLTTNSLVVLLLQIRSLERFKSDWIVISPFIIALWLMYISLIQLKLPLITALLFINKLDPDIIIDYNGFGFDYQYMYKRSTVLSISPLFCDLGRIKGKVCKLEEKKLMEREFRSFVPFFNEKN